MTKTSGEPVNPLDLRKRRERKKGPQRRVARGGIHWQQVGYTVRNPSDVGAAGQYQVSWGGDPHSTVACPFDGRTYYENDNIEMQYDECCGTVDRAMGDDLLWVAGPGPPTPSPLEWGYGGFKTNRTLPSRLQKLMLERLRDGLGVHRARTVIATAPPGLRRCPQKASEDRPELKRTLPSHVGRRETSRAREKHP